MLSKINTINSEVLAQLQSRVIWHNYEYTLSDAYHERVLVKVDQFLEAMNNKKQSADYYHSMRNATNKEYTNNNIRIGKYGEFAAALILRQKGLPDKGKPFLCPDVEVREGIYKGWDCDLPFKTIDSMYPNCHVKTCDQRTSDYVRKMCGDQYSWTFQYANSNGPGGRDNLFNNPNSTELVLFMFVPSMNAHKANLMFSAPWCKLQGILKNPLKEDKKGLKKCVYLKDLLLLANCAQVEF